MSYDVCRPDEGKAPHPCIPTPPRWLADTRLGDGASLLRAPCRQLQPF